LQACAADLRDPASASSTVLNCNGTVGNTTASFSVFGEAIGPSSSRLGTLLSLGDLKTKATIGYTENLATPYFSALQASSFASFTQGVNYDPSLTNSMTFDFKLHGSLALDAHPANTGDNQSNSSVSVALSAFSAFSAVSGDGTFSRVLHRDGQTTERLTYLPSTSSDFQITREVLHPEQFHLLLGPAFFGPGLFPGLPNTLYLTFSMASLVGIQTWAQINPRGANGLSDFSQTFSMTDLHIYDANGADVTASAFRGFTNVAVAAVPEPDTYALFLAGMGALGFLARRRRRGA